MNEPKIVYKLLDILKGVILTRNVQIVSDEILVRFECAPEGAVAVFQFDNGREAYKELKDGECYLKLSGNEGNIKVTVIILDGICTPKRWMCEQLVYSTLQSGEYTVFPNDMNLPQSVTELKIENEELRIENAKIHKRLDEIETRLTNIMEGYNLI